MVDQLLSGLFGSQEQEDDDRRRARARDFVNRYERGHPSEGYSDEEVMRNYRAVTDQLSPQQFEDAAAESFGRLSAEERKQLRRAMRRGGGRFEPASDDPRELAKAASRFRQEDPGGGGLASLFGFGGSDDPQKRGGLLDAERDQGGGLLDSGLAKAAMAGVAAIAVKKFLDSR